MLLRNGIDLDSKGYLYINIECVIGFIPRSSKDSIIMCTLAMAGGKPTSHLFIDTYSVPDGLLKHQSELQSSKGQPLLDFSL